MSNSYTHFVVGIQVKNPKARKWVETLLDKAHDIEAGYDAKLPKELAAMFPDWEDWPGSGFDYTFQKDGRKTILYLEDQAGACNLEHVVSFIQAYLLKFDPKGRVGFEYANTGDRAVPGEYGGGAVVVTATSTKWNSTYEWLQKELAA